MVSKQLTNYVIKKFSLTLFLWLQQGVVVMATLIQENGIKELSKGTHGVVSNHGITTHSVASHMVPDHEYCEAGAAGAQPCSAPDPAPAPPADEEDTPEIDIMINNVVCSFSVKCHLNLRQIALNGVNVEFRRENGMVTMKLRRPYTTASIWSSGRVTCTGATSEDQAKVAARRYARALQKLGFQVRFQNFRVVNVLGTCRMPFGIRIIAFSNKYKEAEWVFYFYYLLYLNSTLNLIYTFKLFQFDYCWFIYLLIIFCLFLSCLEI